MIDSKPWAFPASLQPKPDDVQFDLDSVLNAVVTLHTQVAEDAFTAPILGTERIGNGVVIRESGLIVTIGYLMTEAETIWLTTNNGTAVEGYPIAYDFATGFGLVQPLGKLDIKPIECGSAARMHVNDEVILIGRGGQAHAVKGKLLAKREFAGYWEYLLDEALFSGPLHPEWSGAAMVDMQGRLIGIGSLFIQEVTDEEPVQGNMFVPIDLLEPIVDSLATTGVSGVAPRPWLGMYTTEAPGLLVVNGLAPGSPAEKAGVKSGDLVVEVKGKRVGKLSDMLRSVWELGPAGTTIPLTMMRDGTLKHVEIKSANRADFLKKERLH